MIENNAVEPNRKSKLADIASKIPVIAQLKTIVEKVREWKFAIWASQYNYSQWCYFIAGILVVWNFLHVQEPSYILAGWVAFIGLVRELLHLVKHIWDNLIGKTVILIIYASTANIAIAYAAMQINSITGIEPTPFVFSLGFTALVLLPIWVTLSTIVVFSFFLVAVNLWLLIRLPLKMIGFNLQLHWEDKKNAVLTMLLRIVLVPFAVAAVLSLTYPYLADFVDEPLGLQTQSSDTPSSKVTNEPSKEGEQVPLEMPVGEQPTSELQIDNIEPLTKVTSETEDQLPTTAPADINMVNNDVDNLSPSPNPEPLKDEKEQTRKAKLTLAEAIKTGNLDEDIAFNFELPDIDEPENEWLAKNKKPVRQLIAHFIWFLEAYPYSKCIKPENARTVPIDEIAVLIITQDESAELGYQYEVTECELRNKRL